MRSLNLNPCNYAPGLLWPYVDSDLIQKKKQEDSKDRCFISSRFSLYLNVFSFFFFNGLPFADLFLVPIYCFSITVFLYN